MHSGNLSDLIGENVEAIGSLSTKVDSMESHWDDGSGRPREDSRGNLEHRNHSVDRLGTHRKIAGAV